MRCGRRQRDCPMRQAGGNISKQSERDDHADDDQWVIARPCHGRLPTSTSLRSWGTSGRADGSGREAPGAHTRTGARQGQLKLYGAAAANTSGRHCRRLQLNRRTNASGRPLFHHSEIMLGVLIAILHLDGIAAQRRFPCQRHVTLVIPLSISWRAVVSPRTSLALVVRSAGVSAVSSRAHSLHPEVALAVGIHAARSPYRTRPARCPRTPSATDGAKLWHGLAESRTWRSPPPPASKAEREPRMMRTQ